MYACILCAAIYFGVQTPIVKDKEFSLLFLFIASLAIQSMFHIL